MYVIWNLTHMAYRAPSFGKASRVYTDKLELARLFKSRHAAQTAITIDDDEQVCPLSDVDLH